MHLDDPHFPSLLKPHAVRAPVRPFAEACRLARSGRLGAGDVVWSRNTARAELAIVLEPEIALGQALQMVPLMMVALGDCLGALCPPKVAISYRWPQAILLNGSAAGEVRTACPRGASDRIPDWLIVGVVLDIAAPKRERKDWSRTSLEEEAGPGISRTDVLQGLAAHFLKWLDTWQEQGFRPVHDNWLFRAHGREQPIRLVLGDASVEGRVLGLDEAANLLIESPAGQVHVLSYLDAVEAHG
jgi:biotin-(acetyl-CoA carboxylase) ligase